MDSPDSAVANPSSSHDTHAVQGQTSQLQAAADLDQTQKKMEALCKLMDSQLAFFKPFLPHAALKLGIPWILADAGRPLTGLEIAEWLPCPAPNIHNLLRILRALVVDDYLQVHGQQEQLQDAIDDVDHEQQDHEAGALVHHLTRFRLSVLGEALRKSAERGGGAGLVDWIDLPAGTHEKLEEETSPFLLRAYSYSHLHEAVLSPVVVPLEKAVAYALGGSLLKLFGDYETKETSLFVQAMAEASNLHLAATLPTYQGFRGVTTVVDVGGADGTALARIREHNPHVKGINFDLPQVVATAAPIPGVEHVGGNMFRSIPKGDAMYLKWILHELNDENSLRVLSKCKEALSSSRGLGKLIIHDTVVPPLSHPDKDRIRSAVYLDLAMMANTPGHERTEIQWRSLLRAAGFVDVTIDVSHAVYFCLVEARLAQAPSLVLTSDVQTK